MALSRKLPESAHRVFKGELFEVWQWPQTMFDGTVATFEALKRPNTATIIAAVDGKVLISEEQQPDTDVFVSMPGGRCEEGEDGLVAAKRELLEETGYASDDWVLLHEHHPFGKMMWTIYAYIARGAKKLQDAHLDAGERITPKLVTFDEFLMLPDEPRFRTWELNETLLRARLDAGKKEELYRLLFPHAA